MLVCNRIIEGGNLLIHHDLRIGTGSNPENVSHIDCRACAVWKETDLNLHESVPVENGDGYGARA